jgi:type IV pilus assembly protein PilF
MRTALRLAILASVAAIVGGCASSAEREAENARRQKLFETQVQLGAVYLQREQYEIAKDQLVRALEYKPDDPQANNVMAVLQWKIREYPEAERYFRRAIENDERNAAAHHNYGAFLCDRGRIEEGVRELDKAIAQPAYAAAAEANVNAGLCHMSKPAPVAAEKYFREALRLKPDLPAALLQMAHISYDSGRALAARGYLQRYQQVTAETPDSLLLAVRVETALNDKNAAASYALRLRSKFPTSDEAQKLARETAGQGMPDRKGK